MHRSSSRDGGSKPRRKTIFGLSSLTQINPTVKDNDFQEPSKTLRKRRTPSVPVIETSDMPPDSLRSPPSLHSSPSKARRPSLGIRPSIHRPSSSVFGSLRSMRSSGEDETPLSTTSSKAPSLNWTGDLDMVPSYPKPVIYHGEVQTSSSMFRKKREYLVLTDTHLIRCKSQGKASEMFPAIPPAFGRSPTIRHSSTQSTGSTQDLQSLASDSSGDKDGRIPLRQVVAVHTLDDGKPYFAVEVCYLDEESNQASAMTLQFSHPDERDNWLRSIRSTTTSVRLQDPQPITPYNANYAARTVERENDYDPNYFAMYKVVQRLSSKSNSRSSTDDLSKIASVVCFLAIGIHKVHLIPLAKNSSRTSSPSLSQNAHGSFGIMTLSGVRVSSQDDTLELSFRQPLKRARILHLSSSASRDIALRLYHVDNHLRPESVHRPFKFIVPPELEDQILPPVESNHEEHSCLDRTLTAYCIAYDVNPGAIRYTIDYSCEDAPRFELLPITEGRRRNFSLLELLAVMRALRYNESFGSISFADVRLDGLNGVHDPYGTEYVCSRTKLGTPIKLNVDELARSSLLVQEIRALAATSKRLRRMDFSGCITTKPSSSFDDSEVKSADIGCGIVEALFPLCRHQTTNVDWIALNGITLSDLDLDYLVGAAVDRSCHFRALELSRCGLNDRTMGLVLDALRAQDNTLEALDISGNLARLSPTVFDSQISVFGFIRQLNLSNLSRTSGSEPLLTADTLLTWRLETLRLSGMNINERTVEELATYLRSPQSDTLHELFLDHAYLTGSEIAILMRAMHRNPQYPRKLHLDISHNQIAKDHDKLVDAITDGHSPTHLTLRAMEYRDETVLRHILNALRQNHSTTYLDISRASLPGDASEETSTALERLFAENDTLEDLNISGEDSRLEMSKFGAGLNKALGGLKRNKRLHVLRIQYQKLGFPGAAILADVLRENDTLRELHCEHNDIPLSAFTDLVNTLCRNTTLVYLPRLEEGRAMALKHTERQVKQIRDEVPHASTSPPASPVSKGPTFGVRRGLASVKRNVTRSSSAYTPSFPSLPSSSSNRHVSLPLSSSPLSSKTRLAPSSGPVAAPLPQLSEQDIQAALRLVSESWDRQQYRLQQYLDRNWCLLNGIPTNMEIEEEDFERPSSDSLSKVLEKVKIESTPTAEKELDFGTMHNLLRSSDAAEGRNSSVSEASVVRSPEAPSLPLPVSGAVGESFKDFLLSSTSESPELDEGSNVDDEEGDESPADGDGGLEIHGLGIKTPTRTAFARE